MCRAKGCVSLMLIGASGNLGLSGWLAARFGALENQGPAGGPSSAQGWASLPPTGVFISSRIQSSWSQLISPF